MINIRQQKMNKKEKIDCRYADNTNSNRFSQIRKKSVVICINLCHLCAYLGEKSEKFEENKEQVENLSTRSLVYSRSQETKYKSNF
jgi:hypothetical protein